MAALSQSRTAQLSWQLRRQAKLALGPRPPPPPTPKAVPSPSRLLSQSFRSKCLGAKQKISLNSRPSQGFVRVEPNIFNKS